ncbi:EAL domain-containing protein [Paenibacillus spiritus]|uniref:EAL domain-containing protein n=1 Tax=Paenibacillus spiritus TaxID=2496557 RepID=A0A5J5G2A4_9BACL|nr:EAL domain-containing protein [Paenibacillus spiritus]KAA9000959.1 EAL domain-containing protein [Paenibacillus spiritus]
MKQLRPIWGIILFLVLVPSTVLAERREIRYEAELNYPPYKYVQDGFLTGFDVDLTHMVFERQSYQVFYSGGNWNALYRKLVDGKIDTAGLMAVTPERQKEVLFSKKVTRAYLSVYSLQSRAEGVTLKTLGKYKVGVRRGQYSEDVVRDKLGLTGYAAYEDLPEALEALRHGEIDVLLENQAVIDHMIIEQGWSNAIIHRLSNLYPVDIAYGVSRSSSELVPYINARLDELRRSGAFEELHLQYFFRHSDYYRQMTRERVMLGTLIGACLLAFGFVFIRMYIQRLRRTIEAEQRLFSNVVGHAGILVWAAAADGRTVRMTAFTEETTGLQESELAGKRLEELELSDPGLQELRNLLLEAVEGRYSPGVEARIPRNGRYFLLKTIPGPRVEISRGMNVAVLVGIDVDDLKKNALKLQSSYENLESAHCELEMAQEELQEQMERLRLSQQRFRAASEGSGAYIWELDITTGRYDISERWFELMGYTPEEFYSRSDAPFHLMHPDDIEAAERARRAHLEGRTPFYETEYRMRTKEGRYLWFGVRGKASRSPESGAVVFLGSLIDITGRKETELQLSRSYQELEATYEELTVTQEELMDQYEVLLDNQEKMHRLAYYDGLTGLPNRLMLLETLERCFQGTEGRAALLFLDTDNFKFINDTMGHRFGDALLVKTSERVQQLIRDHDMLCRLGGDEFVILCKRIYRREEVLNLAESIVESFKQPFQIGETRLYVSLSIGISFYPEDGRTTEEILKNADVAMYRAKDSGKNRYVVYDKTMHTEFNERLHLEKHLRGALENKEFELFYQPQVDIAGGQISGFEALIRWNSPELGFVSPLAFIRIAEDSRLIVPIGEWVLREACRFLGDVQAKKSCTYKISVNISVIQLLQDDFVEIVLDAAQESRIEPGCLELEITESVFMESYERIVGKLERLKAEGFRIALDDFGKGYSSLSYLQQLPLSTLKVDKAFIDPLTEDAYSQTFIRTIVALGHDMGLEVVAEGVERSSQLEILEHTGCDKVQGYLISRPVPEKHALELLNGPGNGKVC